MGNVFCADAQASDPAYTGTTSYAGTSSMFTSRSQENPMPRGLKGSNASENDCNSHSMSTNMASLKVFSYNDLKAATRNFRPEGILGEGGFGLVYKGYVDEHTLVPSRPGQGMVVAIKKLKLGGMQGHKEWLAEVHVLGALHHPNLVKLIGFCAEDSSRLLVYEYMPRGSLENHLFRKGRHGATMPWETRIKIAVGAARGLAFLHGAERQVIYRDFKASNILLDNQYNAKLSDFGLAKDGPMGDDTHVSTRIMGTYGYAAPEYLATGHLSARSDVYSFGVVLLELLTGLKTVDNNRPQGKEKLVDWAKPYLSGRRQVMHILDEKLQGQCTSQEVFRVSQLSHRCLDEVAKARPSMTEVVDSLERLLNAA